MPKWMRLPSTRDESLAYRMGSVMENGPADNGPLAFFLAWGGCLGAVALVFLTLIGVIASPFIALWVVFF
ncbi:hypothetical protein HUN41_00191 [Streptomyces phage Coruscant]|uniref:Uncharacterized protein n=1 Tax=Streptomyces phage Coruscant TaxID=2739834 RepID=A0A7G4AW94_9CAUD|nr:hypothetical protein PP454_gp133 [Streptomyces phage Coruscant]QMP84284.1 hypothetical protein HUN41_00191 [Streptomyces phage Coruscant]